MLCALYFMSSDMPAQTSLLTKQNKIQFMFIVAAANNVRIYC